MERPAQGIPHAESILRPNFHQLLHACAERLRSGAIRDQAALAEVWNVAGQIGPLGYDVEQSFMGPDGEPLDRADAELVWHGRSPDAWKFSEAESRGLARAHELFSGKHDEFDLPLELIDPAQFDGQRGRAARIREWLGETLGLANPDRFSLDELAQMAYARLELSRQLQTGGNPSSGQHRLSPSPAPPESPARPASRTSDKEYHLVPLAHAGTVIARAVVNAPVNSAPSPHIQPPYVPRPRRAYDSNGDFQPSTPFRGEVRSHRRPREWAARLKKISAVAAMAVVAFLSPNPITQHKAAEPTPMINLAPPPPQPIVSVDSGLPHQQPPPSAQERWLTPGKYDPQTRSGAIWFMVERYAADLGEANLTLTQTYRLTQKTLDYLHLSWSEAVHVLPGAALRFPSEEIMRTWLDDVIGNS